MSQTQKEKFWNSSETKTFPNPEIKVIIKFNANNPDTRRKPKVDVKCPNCGHHNIRKFVDETIQWFECEKCNFPLAVTLHNFKAKGYVDDQYCMGLMTSGPGGY